MAGYLRTSSFVGCNASLIMSKIFFSLSERYSGGATCSAVSVEYVLERACHDDLLMISCLWYTPVKDSRLDSGILAMPKAC